MLMDNSPEFCKTDKKRLSCFLLTCLLNSVSVIPVVIINNAWWFSDILPFKKILFELSHLNNSVYNNACIYAVCLMAIQLLTGLITSTLAGNKGNYIIIAKAFSPFVYCGIIALLCFLPLYPFTAIGPYMLFTASVLSLYNLIGIIRKLIPGSGSKIILNAQKAGTLIFVIVIIIYLAPWFKITWSMIDKSRDSLLTGDQPAYLYITDSLVEDQDLDVSNNNLSENTYHGSEKSKHAGGIAVHNPDMSHNTKKYSDLLKKFGEVQYSTHRCGLPMIISPFYFTGKKIGGWERRLIVLFLILIVAAGFSAILHTACELGVSPASALLMGLSAALAAPSSCMSTAIFPEVIVFFIIARMMYVVVKNKTGWFLNLEIAIWFSLSPWLQDKYGLWTLPFFLTRIIQQKNKPLSLIPMSFPLLFSGIMMVKRNLFLYNQILPRNTVGYFLTVKKALLEGLPGTWFDWGYGLVMLAPYTLLILGGIVAWILNKKIPSEKKSAVYGTVLTLLTGWIIIGMWFGWHGGFAPPNRFMFTILPLCIVLSMVATKYLAYPWQNAAIVLWLISAFFGFESLFSPSSWYSISHTSQFATSVTGFNSLAVRFPPFYYGESAANIKAILLSVTGFIFMVIFGFGAWNKWSYNPISKCKEMLAKLSYKRTLSFLLIIAFMVLAIANSANIFSSDIAKNDVITSIGTIHNPKLLYKGNSITKLSCNLSLKPFQYFHQLAFAIHYLDSEGKLLSQDDFDLETYTTNWLHNKKNKRQYSETGLIKINRKLNIPDNASYARIAIYNPVRGISYHNLRKTTEHILRTELNI
ncbi:MAG: hypothetical protein P9M03_11865 [Candidatus Theseobacter exili]|nr:hypothetical protein [Candidatus Theseobacter exili]